jgi:hypothetical protein
MTTEFGINYGPRIRTFDTGATRDTDAGKPEYRGLLPPPVIPRFGEYMNRHRVQPDGNLRASDNWRKGIPNGEYVSSGWRHFLDVWAIHEGTPVRETDIEEALCGLLFNTMGYLHEVLQEKHG